MKKIEIRRFRKNPIIYPELDDSVEQNITGPSLIQLPDWIEDPLGKYYLFFASHKGSYIKLAYAENLKGPWKVFHKGSLHIRESYFPIKPPKIKTSRTFLGENIPHIASPDVHILDEEKEVRMYFHGLESNGRQVSRVARSQDGIHFKTEKEIISPPYLRVFQYDNYYYGMSMPGIFYRSRNGLNNFDRGPTLFTGKMRHSALRIYRDQLEVFWTRVGDAPERILLSNIKNIDQDWFKWEISETIEVLSPQKKWEGGNLPPKPSKRGPVNEKVCQLRDPAIFEEENKLYLLYVVGGEKGIAIAEIVK